MASEESPSSPRFCANQCGFYANSATGELCSKCYREMRRDEERNRPEDSAAELAVAATVSVAVADSLGEESKEPEVSSATCAVADTEQSSGTCSPGLCANHCGFYANAGTGDLCSKCYIDLLKEETAKNPETSATQLASAAESTVSSSSAAPTMGAAVVTNSVACSSSVAAAAAALASSDSALACPGGDLSAKGRCASCNKKLGLLKGFACKCGNSYCSAHRYAEQHGCVFDYKAAGRAFLKKKNPVIKSDKLEKI